MEQSKVIIGTPVIYWKVIKEDGMRLDPVKTEITSEPWELGHGEVVCKVKDISGGVSIEHLDLMTPGALFSASIQAPDQFSMNMFQNATKEFFNSKGINVIINNGEEQK